MTAMIRRWRVVARAVNSTARTSTTSGNDDETHVAARLLRDVPELERASLRPDFFSFLQSFFVRLIDECQGRRRCRQTVNALTTAIVLNETQWVRLGSIEEPKNVTTLLAWVSTPYTRDLVLVRCPSQHVVPLQ